jgi:hypothetical protein
MPSNSHFTQTGRAGACQRHFRRFGPSLFMNYYVVRYYRLTPFLHAYIVAQVMISYLHIMQM